MKGLYYLVLLALITSPIYGQTETYFEGKELKQYEGEWLGFHNKDTFRIILQYKEKYQMPGSKLFVDAIFGWHSFIENGVKKSSTITYPLDLNNHSITMGKSVDGKIFMRFADKKHKNGSAKISFAFIRGSKNQAVWKIEEIVPREGLIMTATDKDGNVIKQIGQSENDYPDSQITSVSEWHMTRVK